MNMFYLTLAWHYLWSKNRDTSITTMMRVCFLGISLGTLALTLTLCIMQGFEHATQQKLQSISPAIIIRAAEEPLIIDALQKIVKQDFPEIAASAPNMQQFVMIQDPQAKALSTIATLKAIDPDQEEQVTNLQAKLLHPLHKKLAELVFDNRVLIGSKLAEQLGIKTGGTFTIWYMPDHQNKKNLEKTTLVVSGIFKTGLEEYDANLIISHLDLAQELFPDQTIDELGIRIKNNSNITTVTKALKTRLHTLEVLSWHELYPALVSALKLEKYVMFFIIMLIVLVASMNTISLIFMQITQKRRDIAILQAYGMPDKAIRATFFCIGLLIGICGALTGLGTALLLGLIIQHFPFINLPDVYYSSYLPISLDPTLFLIVFITALVLTSISTFIPLKDIKRINIANVLRFEG